MQIHFEKWIKEQDVSLDALTLFDESIMCYRVGAYRASFMMSYLGFMVTLKDRLLKGPNPVNIHEETWKKHRNDIENTLLWETTVFSLAQKKTSGKNPVGEIFLTSNDLIQDIEYWKRKRNECAHAKGTIIGYSHVDTFWLFLESNLSKFMVNGGEAALISKFSIHTDKRFTEPDADFKYLIEEIPLVVKHDKLGDFYKKVEDNYIPLEEQKSKLGYKFWKVIAYSQNPLLNQAFLDYIASDTNVLIRFLEIFPDKLVLLKTRDQLIRHFWTELIFKMYGSSSDSFWDLSIILLRNNMVPTNEIPEFVSKIANKMTAWGIPTEDQTRDLNKFGFLLEVRKRWFDNSLLNKTYTGYTKANQDSYLIMYYLKVAPLDEVVVKELNALFSSYNHGTFYNKLSSYIQNNPDFLADFKEIAINEELELVKFFSEEPTKQEIEE
ncbi:hypothetical protein ACQKJC_18530 [Priestia koreensis]|uniref:hypothetical protein n=1 Tax=Priestia koreensis TaxID=284581 RepID=UPI003CFF8AC0